MMFVTSKQFGGLIAAFNNFKEETQKQMSTQQDALNTITTEVTTLKANLDTVTAAQAATATALAAVKTEISTLEGQVAAGQPVDLTNLKSLVDAALTESTTAAQAETANATTATSLEPPASS